MLVNRAKTKYGRLISAADYRLVFESSNCRSSDEFFFVIARKNGLDQGRLGFAIAKKKIRLAINRNRIKRLIRESFYHHQNTLKGIDVVVMVQKEITLISNKKITQSINIHWDNVLQCRKH